MLVNHQNRAAIEQYKQIFLANFIDETSDSFDYLLNHIVHHNNIYLSLDSQNNVQLGLMVIEKTICKANQTFKGALIYGVVASQAYKGTKIVARLFPDFLQQLKTKYDFVLLESHQWKIYKEIALLDVNKYNIYELTNEPNYDWNDIQIKDVTYATALKCLGIYQKHLNNFNIKNYVKYDAQSLSDLFNLNTLMGDRLLVIDNAYALWNVHNNQVYSLVFDSISALKQLIEYLPACTQIVLNDALVLIDLTSLKLVDTFIKTKQVIGTNQINELLFNEIN